jgi:hypothetical protein
MSDYDPCAHSRRKVREHFPDAECVPDGLMWVIQVNGGRKIISQRLSATHRAWISAAEYVAANAGQQPRAPEAVGEGSRDATQTVSELERWGHQ